MRGLDKLVSYKRQAESDGVIIYRNWKSIMTIKNAFLVVYSLYYKKYSQRGGGSMRH